MNAHRRSMGATTSPGDPKIQTHDPGLAAGDPRLKPRRFSWKEFGVIFIGLLILAVSQLMIRSAFPDSVSATRGFQVALVIYWAIVAFLICLLLAHQRQRVFDKPMRQLSDAATRVAGGDFGVRLPIAHPRGRWDYVDVMFDNFNTMVEQLASTEALKDGFIADVSHELKTPLAVIGNYAHVLQDGDRLSAEQRRDYSQVIVKASSTLAGMVANILKLNRLEHEQMSPAMNRFDVARQLADVALGAADAFDAKGVSFEADLEDSEMVTSDEPMLELVWQNLLGNALKFTPPGGHVSLRQTSSLAGVVVVIADTGIGMDESTQAHIFEKFYRGGDQVGVDGNGLGLALVARAVHLVRAEVQVESTPGEGSTFTVILPQGTDDFPCVAV